MSPRPLRQFYGHDRSFVIDGLGPAVEPFRRHRARFLDALRSLSEHEWTATTRCDAWDAKDVAHHLASADGFWAMALQGRHNPEPTTFLRGFDPTASPEAIIAPRRDEPASTALEALKKSTAQLADALAGVGDDEWSWASESPFGHVPVRIIAAHSLWDSWLHERDVMIPLGGQPCVEEDELLTAAAFTLFLGGAQGGVLDDGEPVGDGPDEPLEVRLGFDELANRTVGLRVDRDVRVDVLGAGGGSDAGSAIEFVEAISGRRPTKPVLDRLPADVAAQLARARQVL